jgi:tRNA C32,U32 (ribose-2'-O)-methylase TrmJ
MQQENEQKKISPEQLKRLLHDLTTEVTRVESIKRMSELRVRRYNDITSRVKFMRKSPEKMQRDLRRLYTAHRFVEQAISSLNTLTAQIDQYTQQLEAA